MRMEELSNSQYIKSTDTVEKYLLDIIQQYFKSNNIASENSREHIIQKAVKRMKDELDFDSLGVLSIIMPDGEVRVGNVTLTLEELGGEPLILPKRSAFNVDFGEEAGTACEGNDPRLSDKRLPLAHKHKIADIKNLSNELSTINGKIDRIISHTHDNKDILDKIVYTGTRGSIDLADVEQIESRVRQLIQQNNNDIATYHDVIDGKIAQLNIEIDALNQNILDLKDFVIDRNEAYKRDIIGYADSAIEQANLTIGGEMANLVTKAMLTGIVAIASSTYTHLGTATVQMSTVLNSPSKEYEMNVSSIINDINAIHPMLTSDDVIVQATIKVNGSTYDLPFIVMNGNTFSGMITASYKNNVPTIKAECTNAPSSLSNATITVKYYTRQTITL